MEISLFDSRVAINRDEIVEKRQKSTRDNGELSSHNDDPNLYYDNSSNPYHQHISMLRAIGSPYDLRTAGRRLQAYNDMKINVCINVQY